MTSTRQPINKMDIKAILPLKTWWAMIFVLPLSLQVIHFVVNRTKWTPNIITFTGILLRLTVAGLFLSGTSLTLIVGALTYILAYVCDCTDGAVARLTHNTSELGRYLDHMSDLIGDILILLALAWSQGVFFTYWIWAMVFMHVSECYISYLTGFILKHHEGSLGNFSLFRVYNKYRRWWFRRNTKSFFSFPDYNALVFVLFPLLGRPMQGLKVGFYVLMVIVFYTIFSTFVSVHTEEKRFP